VLIFKESFFGVLIKLKKCFFLGASQAQRNASPSKHTTELDAFEAWNLEEAQLIWYFS
jgi:hypothetical protein